MPFPVRALNSRRQHVWGQEQPGLHMEKITEMLLNDVLVTQNIWAPRGRRASWAEVGPSSGLLWPVSQGSDHMGKEAR